MATEAMQEEKFEKTPAGQARRWQMELTAARKEVEKWHIQGSKIIKRFRDERESGREGETRWNIFSSNIQTQRAMLYGKPPSVSVDRRFADAGDDVARVGSEILERLLNTDIERDSDGYSLALQYALDDRLIPGFGQARIRYVAQFEQIEGIAAQISAEGIEIAAEVPPTERKISEDVETDYVHWKDMLWSPARVWHEVRWVAFKAQMSREQLRERFKSEDDEGFADKIPLNTKSGNDSSDSQASDPWSRADVWEIWSKDDKKVYWYVDGFHVTLDEKDDPLGLEGFWPCPRPMMANLTTASLIPRPDYVLAQDLYEEIDLISTRINLLQKAIRVAGVYDRTSEGIKRLVSEASQNELIPVDNWAIFAEKGGVRGAVDWLPLDQIVGALAQLRDYRRELMDAVFQITGMSDIMRGQANSTGVTATEQSIKAKFGSVRIQAMQDEFARFASDIQRLKAEVIAKHFDAQTILQRCNCQFTPDAPFAEQAVQLIKSEASPYRVQVKPEAVSLTDFSALKQERMEVLAGLSGFLQATAPLAQQMPSATPFLLQMLQWAMSGIRGASSIEGVLDQAIAAAQQAAQQPQQAAPPDPKLAIVQAKAQADMAKEQAKLQGDLVRIQAEVAGDAARENTQREQNVRESAQKAQISHAFKTLNGSGLGGGL